MTAFDKHIKNNHGLSRHPLYRKWVGMKQRCYNKKFINYKNYGGRGVIICEEWKNNFLSFYNWSIKNGWKPGLEIDKDIIGNGKMYSPHTCCFVTRKKNLNRKNSNVYFNNKRYSIRELSIEFDIPYDTLLKRIRSGVALSDAIIKTPIGRNATYRNKRSKYPGVSLQMQTKKWRCVIYENGKQRHLGYFDNEIDAAMAYKIELSKIA